LSDSPQENNAPEPDPAPGVDPGEPAESPTPPGEQEVPLVSTPTDDPHKWARRAWHKVLDIPHLAAPVRRLAMRQLTRLDAQDWQRSWSRRDPAENAATRLPPGEEARVPLILLAEVFTPTTIDSLIDGMGRLARKSAGMSLVSGAELAEWVRSSRQGRVLNSVRYIGYVAPKGIDVGPKFEAEVPPGIKHVHLSVQMLTPTVTMLTAAFRLHDDYARGLEAILDKNIDSRTEKSENGYGLLTVGMQKDRATDQWRAHLRRDAAEWIAKYFPGSFHRLAPGQLPTIELLVTRNYQPWEPTSDPSEIPGWAGILDIGGWLEYWQCAGRSSFRLSERHIRSRNFDLRHALVLATAKEPRPGNETGDTVDEASILPDLNSVATGLLARWSLLALVRELAEQLPRMQDTAERASRKQGFRQVVRTVTALQQENLRSGLDSRIVVGDIVSFTQNPMWRTHLLSILADFSEVIPARRSTAGPGAASLIELWRSWTAAVGREILRSERDLREVLSTNAALTGAAANLRLQRTTIWIAVLSGIIAAVAAAAAVLAIWHPGTSTPSPHAPPITHHGTSPSSTTRPK
jgi:hypothetical protein